MPSEQATDITAPLVFAFSMFRIFFVNLYIYPSQSPSRPRDIIELGASDLVEGEKLDMDRQVQDRMLRNVDTVRFLYGFVVYFVTAS